MARGTPVRPPSSHPAIHGGEDPALAASKPWVGDLAPAPGHVRCAAARLVPHVVQQRAGRRAGLRHGATLRLRRRRHQAGPAPPTPVARRAGPARRAPPSANARAWPARSASGSGSGPPGRPVRPRTTCKCGNSHGQECRPPGGPGGDQVARVTGPARPGFAQVTGLTMRFSAWNPVSCQQPRPEEDARSEHTYGGPAGPPLLYFAAVLPVRSVRISLLTSGAKRARTADLLHAMQALYQLSYSPDTTPMLLSM